MSCVLDIFDVPSRNVLDEDNLTVMGDEFFGSNLIDLPGFFHIP